MQEQARTVTLYKPLNTMPYSDVYSIIIFGVQACKMHCTMPSTFCFIHPCKIILHYIKITLHYMYNVVLVITLGVLYMACLYVRCPRARSARGRSTYMYKQAITLYQGVIIAAKILC